MRTMTLENPIIDIRDDGSFEIMEMPKAGALMLRGNQAKALMNRVPLKIVEKPNSIEKPYVTTHEKRLPDATFG